MILELIRLVRWSKKRKDDKNQAVPGATGSTALHVSCANGCVKIVDLLIRNNARIDVKDKYGSTPLDVAQAKHKPEIVKILEQAKDKQKKKRQKPRSSSCTIDENEGKMRKSINGAISTQKRTGSDKGPRVRRPSLSSIFEDHRPLQIPNIPSTISMIPSSTQVEKNNTSLEVLPVVASSAHRPLSDEVRVVHASPVTANDQVNRSKKPYHSKNSRSPRSSDDSAVNNLFTSSRISASYPTDDWTSSTNGLQQPDWYGYGVVNSYDDENYLLSLERRAFNKSPNKNNDLERQSQDITINRPVDNPTYYRPVSSKSHSTVTAKANGDSLQQQDSYKLNRLADSGFGSQKLRTTAMKNAMAANSTVSLSTNDSLSHSSDVGEEKGDDDNEEVKESDEEKEYNSEPLLHHSSMLNNVSESNIRRRIPHQTGRQRSSSINEDSIHQDTKNKWFTGFSKNTSGRHSFDNSNHKSLDLRPNFDSLTQFAKRGISSLTINQDEGESSDDGPPFHSQNHKSSGLFSKWAPSWGRKQC